MTDLTEKLSTELHIAQKMQYDLLPSESYLLQLRKQHGLAVDKAFEASDMLSGDFWGCTPLNDEEIALYFCDFSGHGLAAAINTFRFHTLLTEQIDRWGRDASHFMNMLNQQLHRLLASEQFATMFYATLHKGLNSLFYVGAGCPQPLIIRNDGSHEWIDSTGLPVGVDFQWKYKVEEIPFSTGDILVLYSDSLIEYGDIEQWDENRTQIADVVIKAYNRYQNDSECTQWILAELLRHHHLARGFGTPLKDDLTLNIYRRLA